MPGLACFLLTVWYTMHTVELSKDALATWLSWPFLFSFSLMVWCPWQDMLRTSSRSNLDRGQNFVQRCFIAVFQWIVCPWRHQQSWYFYKISGIQCNGFGNLFPTNSQESLCSEPKGINFSMRKIQIPEGSLENKFLIPLHCIPEIL
jgi:hypothetical protein